MKRILSFVFLLSMVTAFSSLSAPSVAHAGRCLGVEPICRPGTYPICVCESDISLRCSWICASAGVR